MKKLIPILLAIGAIFLYFYVYNIYPLTTIKECPHTEVGNKVPKSDELPTKARIAYDICRESGLEFQGDPGDYWKAPFETEADGGGDCEDLSIWLLHKLRRERITARLILGRSMLRGDYSSMYPIFHMWVRIAIYDEIEGCGTVYDIDMVNKTIRRGFIEVGLNVKDWERLREVDRRQDLWEEINK